jgi:outer membrane protein assembly factor BamB
MRMAGVLFLAVTAQAQNVLTQHNDICRSGANLSETHLTHQSVKSGFGKLFSREVDGQIYAQPLIVTGLDIPGKGVRNVVYVATMKNNLYAFDADDPAEDTPFWHKNLGRPVPYELIPVNWGSLFFQYNIKPFIGITSTPVIDVAKRRIWVSVKTMVTDDDIRYYLYALDLVTGEIQATSQPIQSGDGEDKLQGKTALQRPGLLLANNMVYLAFGSQQDGGFYHGWIVAFNADSLEQKYVFCTTCGDPLGMGGIWQAGNGPAADKNGNIYIMTSNGKWQQDKMYGSSFVKLGPDLNVVDWFTPSNYSTLTLEDVDLGSSGPMLLPNDQLTGGGKQGWLYLLNAANMGKLQPKHSVPPALQEFKVSSHWTLNWLSWLIPVFGYHHIHGAPVYWESAQQGGLVVYVWPEESPLQGYRWDPQKHFDTKNYLKGPAAPKGMPGGILSISANGKKDGLLWATTPLKDDAFVQTVQGVLRVFDANTLEQLWSTDDKNGPDDEFNFAKYCPPTIANGKVYLATFSNALNVYTTMASPPNARPAWTTTGRKPIKGRGHGRMRM